MMNTPDEKYEYARKVAKEFYDVENPTDDLINYLVVIDEVRDDIIKRKLKEMEEANK